MKQADPVLALDRAFELAGRLAALMEETLAARGLTTTQAQVIFALNERGPLVQRDLSQELGCTPRHVTTLVDALEAAGAVSRAPHPTDRRATLVSLTEQGEAAAARMASERQDAARALFGHTSASDLRGFVTTVDGVLARLEESWAAGARGTRDAADIPVL